MKKLFVILLAAGLGGVVAAVFVSGRQAAWRAAQAADFARKEAAWTVEKLRLEKSLAGARGRTVTIETPAAAAQTAGLVKGPSARDAVEKLKTLKIAPGPGQTRSMRQVVHELENLIAGGPDALPAIREFLARNEDLDYDANSAGGRGKNGSGMSFDPRISTEFLVPPSLRIGLFDVLRQIGGKEAETLLAQALGTTGRGLEVAYLARVLQEMAPDKYRDLAVNAARDLLTNPPAKGSAPLDKFDQNYLYGVLAFFNDASLVPQAQAQLVGADGRIDRAALKYLQGALGEQSIAIAQQAWNDPRTQADQKEPLARVALTYLGVNPQAEALYQTAINDLSLPKDHRRNLIEDLNQDGFTDRKTPGPRDLALIQNRIEFIQQNAPKAADNVNAAAFAEAYKDLLKMQARATAPKGQ